MGTLNQLLKIRECQSVHGEHVDFMLELIHWFMLILFIGWFAFFCVALWKFNARANPKASHSGVTNHASTHLEIGVVIIELVLLLGFAFPLWGTQVDDIPLNPDVQVRAVGQQFNWTFHYPGPDGKLGNTHSRFYSGTNPAGIDPDDPNGKDDIAAINLTLPKGKKIVVGVTSKDVIHNLALKNVRVATDANPGSLNRVWFVPTKTGKSDIICGQLCGAGHGIMRGEMNIVEPEEYDAWLRDQNSWDGKPLSWPEPATDAIAGTAPATNAGAATAGAATVGAATVGVATVGAATVGAATVGAATAGAGAPASTSETAAPAAPPPAEDPPVEVTVKIVPLLLQFETKEFTVKPGQKVKLTLVNEKDGQPHNIVICKPGTVDAVSSEALKQITQPGYLQHPFPKSPDVLFQNNKLVTMQQSDTFEFVAPEVEGDYPYLCTYPGHTVTMRGVMHVKN